MDKQSLYRMMKLQMASLNEGCRVPLCGLSNCTALLWESMPQINWAGFYLCKDETLYLGPFQGKIACTVIPFTRGVCGACARERRVQLVQDVHQFPGHIACDSASNSEIVLPLIRNGELLGVMDIDSPIVGRFDVEDQNGLEAICQSLIEDLDWDQGLL